MGILWITEIKSGQERLSVVLSTVFQVNLSTVLSRQSALLTKRGKKGVNDTVAYITGVSFHMFCGQIHQGSGMMKLLLALSVQRLLQPCITFLRLSASLGPGLRLKFMTFWTCIM